MPRKRSNRLFPVAAALVSSTRSPSACGPPVVGGCTRYGCPAGPGRTAAEPGFLEVPWRFIPLFCHPERMSSEETVSESDSTLHDASQSDKTWTPERIRALRLSRKETQGQFAAALGVSRPTVSGWERGVNDVSPLSAQSLDQLSTGAMVAPSPLGAQLITVYEDGVAELRAWLKQYTGRVLTAQVAQFMAEPSPPLVDASPPMVERRAVPGRTSVETTLASVLPNAPGQADAAASIGRRRKKSG